MFSQATQRARDVQSAQPVTTGMLKQHYSSLSSITALHHMHCVSILAQVLKVGGAL